MQGCLVLKASEKEDRNFCEDVNMEDKSEAEDTVDVTLAWSDFVHYLEEARYLNGDFSEERDWYRLNPFEILHLGCKSIIQHGFVSQRIGTILVGIGKITPYLLKAPRLFRRILDVLLTTLVSEKSSVFMWKRCWSIVLGIKSSVQQDLRLYFQFVFAVLKQEECIQALCKNQSSSVRCQVEEMYKELKELSISDANSMTILGLEDNTTSYSIPLQVHLITERYGTANFILLWKELGVEDFIKSSSKHASLMEVFITEILKLMEIFLKIISEKDCLKREFTVSHEVIDEETSESVLDGIKNVFSEFVGVLSTLYSLFELQASAVVKVIAYINSIIYSTYANICSVNEVWANARIVETLETLAQFAYDVAKSDGKMASDVLESAIEFLQTAAEFEIPQSKASLVLLPNILSPVLGCKDARLISKALEFGAIALHSKHQKSLLGEGLWYISQCQQLFKPVREIKDQTVKCNRRIDAVLSSISILDGLLEDMNFSSSVAAEEEEIQKESEVLEEKFQGVNGESRGMGEESQVIEGESKEVEEESQQMNENCRSFPEAQPFQEQSLRVTEDIIDVVKDSEDLEEEIVNTDSSIITDIHLLLFELACSMTKAGSSIVHTFAGIIPSLFSPSHLPDLPSISYLSADYFKEFQPRKSTIPWKVDKKELAVKALELCIKCTDHRTSSPFQICSVMLPKVASNISKNHLSDTEKLDALTEFIDLCMSKAHERDAITGLITHGLNLVSMLMPKGMDVSQMKIFLPQMLKSLKKILNSASLLYLSSSCGILMNMFPEKNEKLKDLFCKLLQKGKKNDIRCIHLLSAPWLMDPRFHFVLGALFGFAAGSLKSKDIERLAEILSSLVDIEKQLTHRIEEQESFEDCMKSFVKQLTSPILDDLASLLNRGGFDQKNQESLLRRVSNLTLYKAFFEEELVQRVMSLDIDNFNFDTKIPVEVKQNERMMTLLKSIARRIEHMQLPRYESLKKLLLEVIGLYIQDAKERTVNCSPKIEDDIEKNQAVRRDKLVEDYLNALPQNRCLYSRLLSFGYKEDLWSDEVKVTVTTDGSLNTEENLRQTLLASFTEYVQLLKQLGIPMVKIEGKFIQISEIFADDLTINDLKGRRAIVVKAIDKELSRSQKSRIHERKLQLLTEEERIENDMEAKSKAKLKPLKFTAKTNVKFFDCAACCGPQIIGCYAPNGDHCERPLEIGLRHDSAFASIYDEGGHEIENAELLFMDQGILVYRAYSIGHPYDTSQVWTALFEDLLDKRDIAPSLILPHHLPNRHTWESIRRICPTVLTGVMLGCDFDFSSDWKTYYDSRPESARCGKDIMLHKGFRSSKTRPEFLRQFSLNVGKDLGGMIFDDVMQAMMKNDSLNKFRFLGGAIAEYISESIESGKENRDIIGNIFNYNRWKDKLIRSNNEVIRTKEEIVTAICDFTQGVQKDFISRLDLEDMFRNRRRQFFQLKRFHEKMIGDHERILSSSCFSKITAILKSKVKIIPIDDLPLSIQEEVMHWIFGNEDRVWRNRGGRDGYETIEQYMNFLAHIRNSKQQQSRLPAFPGVLAITEDDKRNSDVNLQVKDIAGYAVGEYMEDLDDEIIDQKEMLTDNPKFYEIVTAWVHPNYRKVNISVGLYLHIFKSVASPFVAFDILQGSSERILKTSPLLHTIKTVLPMTVHTQEKSYAMQLVGEQFERLVIRRRPVKYATIAYEHALTLYEYKAFLLLPIVICLLGIFFYYFTYELQ